MRRLVCLALALATASGCSALNAYPSYAVESGPLCANDIDDDLDGAFDCDDPGCASSVCAERSEAECADGRDNDDDGRVDLTDLGCLHAGRLVAQRCAPIGPSRFDPSFGAPGAPVVDSGWRLVEGVSPTLEPDPDDASRLVARMGGTVTTSLESDVLAGALIGLEASFDIFAPSGAVTSIGLAVDGDSVSGIPDGFQVFVDETGSVLLVGSGLVVYRFPVGPDASGLRIQGRLGVSAYARDGVPQPPRMTAGLVVNGFPVMFDAPRAAPFPGRPPGAIPATMRDGAPLRVRFFGGPGAIVFEASARLDGLNDCIRDGSPADSPVLPAPAIGLARGPGQICVISGEGDVSTFTARAMARRSTDGGLHWDAATTVLDVADLAAALSGPIAISDVALTWTGRDYAGVATITAAPSYGSPVVSTRLVSSPDCIAWEITPSGLDDALPPTIGGRFVTYGIGDVDGAPDTHEITFISWAGGDTAALLRATSADGAMGSFRFVPESVPLPLPARWRLHLFNGLRVLRVGRNRLLLYADPDGLRGYVEEGLGQWTELPTPLLSPSGVAGSFDASALTFPLLAFDAPAESGAPLLGVVAHSGSALVGTCPACGLATVVEPFEIGPR